MFPSKYITPEGHARLVAELDDLWRVQRPKVVQAVAEAAALGDRSENAEYIYGKKMLREIDRRVRYLRKRLDGMVVVSSPPSDPSRIFFGAWVRLEDEDGQELEVRIVGPDEFDPKRNWISLDSPMARALMRKQVDDEVIVHTPSGERSYVILGIRYTP
ncbi:MAG: transcription elongation factor GreB [Halothiobacillaceae bacterium]|jgi:transcription elongation factor GreB